MILERSNYHDEQKTEDGGNVRGPDRLCGRKPLAANADAPEAAPGEPKKEPVAEETKKEENTAEPQDNKQDENAQETLKDAEVKYDKEHPTTNPDGSQKLDGVIVTNPKGSGETGSGETGSGETGSGETGSGETGGTTDPEQKKPEKVEIGTVEKTEKSETNVETKTNPGAEPIVDTNTPPTVEKKPDGSTAITESTLDPRQGDHHHHRQRRGQGRSGYRCHRDPQGENRP